LIDIKLKANRNDIGLKELFRSHLGSAEVIPDPSVGPRLMRRLAVREFFHFNPFSLNIYYIGVILAAGIVALVLASGSGYRSHEIPRKLSDELSPVKNPGELTLPSGHALKAKPELAGGLSSEPRKDNLFAGQVKRGAGDTIRYKYTGNVIKSARVTPNVLLKLKSLSGGPALGNYKLQKRLQPGEPLFVPSVTSGCAPLKVLFRNRSADFDSCQWTLGDGGFKYGREVEWIYDVEGEYNVILKVFRPGGVISVSSTVITVFRGPSARFEVLPANQTADEEIRVVNYSSDGTRFFWNFGDGSTSDQFEPVHRYLKSGNYNVTLRAFSENGCSDSLVVYNALAGSGYFIEFPNAFIPNPDGPSGGYYSSKSDESASIFHPSFSGVSDYQLKIFSKLGVLLFETTDPDIGWDGYFKGQLSNSGVYIWKVRGKFRNGESFIRMGDLTLLNK
jgi:PKD domain